MSICGLLSLNHWLKAPDSQLYRQLSNLGAVATRSQRQTWRSSRRVLSPPPLIFAPLPTGHGFSPYKS